MPILYFKIKTFYEDVTVTNKIVVILLGVIVAAIVILAAPKLFEPSNESLKGAKVTELDQSIERLTKQAKEHRLKAFNAQMEAQKLLPAEWEEYAKKIEEVETNEDAAVDIEKHIEELKAKKQSQK